MQQRYFTYHKLSLAHSLVMRSQTRVQTHKATA
jgi:hypothetical protein